MSRAWDDDSFYVSTSSAVCVAGCSRKLTSFAKEFCSTAAPSQQGEVYIEVRIEIELGDVAREATNGCEEAWLLLNFLRDAEAEGFGILILHSA